MITHTSNTEGTILRQPLLCVCMCVFVRKLCKFLSLEGWITASSHAREFHFLILKMRVHYFTCILSTTRISEPDMRGELSEEGRREGEEEREKCKCIRLCDHLELGYVLTTSHVTIATAIKMCHKIKNSC